MHVYSSFDPHRFLTPDWLTAFGTVGATLLALVLAGWNWISSLLFRPELRIDISKLPPYSEQTAWTNGARVTYYRLSVENKRKTIARDVHVFLESVYQFGADGEMFPAPRFRPMFLKWSHVGEITMPALWTGMPRFCDLLHITEPTRKESVGENVPGVSQFHSVMALDLEAQPNSLGHLLEPRKYLLKLKIAAENCPPQAESVSVMFDGLWYPDPEMFNHVEIEKL